VFHGIGSAGYADEFGKIKFDSNLERRKQKDSDSEVSFRNSQRYRLSAFISGQTEMSFQAKRERRSRGTNQRTRFNQLRFDHELKPWNDISLAMSRYYNGTSNNRSDVSAMYRKIDIEKDTEMSYEVRHYNYRDHDDSVFRVSYSFFK